MSEESQSGKPKLTQTMTMHLNGGSKFSELHYKILADGEETGIKRCRRTDGSPKYLVTCDVLFIGEETFDVLATRGVGMTEWILAHMRPAMA